MRVFRPKFICTVCHRAFGQTEEDILQLIPTTCDSCSWGHKY